MIDPGLTVPCARLHWCGDQPSSVEFGDIYHASDGIAEVLRVFAEPIGFDARCAAAGPTPMAIGEVGFGSGLNFVTFAQRFLERAPPYASLHFISFEARPIDGVEFSRLALRRAGAQPLYRDLANAYPPLLPGWHRRSLSGGRIRLSVYFGDVAAGLADLGGRLPAPMAAWLLDGFDPRRNPACWSADVLRGVAALADQGTAVATFTASGAIRRGLTDAGFAVERIDQRPHKRHTLAGTFTRNGTRKGFVPKPRPHHVAVIGGGLAGVCTSHLLATAGIRTTLIERDPSAALSLPGTVLHTRLRTDHTAASRMRRAAYFFAGDYYRQLGLRPSGALQFTGANLDRTRMEAIATAFAASGTWLRRVDAATASSIAGTPVREAGLYFGDSFIIDGAAVAARVDRPSSFARIQGELRGISPAVGALRLQLADTFVEVDAVVLCTGCPPPITQTATLEVLPVAGQMEIASMTPALSVPVFSQGYVCPLADGRFALGATYEQQPWGHARATAFNLDRAHAWFKRACASGISVSRLGSARGIRGVSSDRLPVIGPMTGKDQAGIYVNLAHGSNGTATAPLGAAIIAEMLGGDFAPVTRAEIEAVAPSRFAARQARRGLRHGARA